MNKDSKRSEMGVSVLTEDTKKKAFSFQLKFMFTNNTPGSHGDLLRTFASGQLNAKPLVKSEVQLAVISSLCTF